MRVVFKSASLTGFGLMLRRYLGLKSLALGFLCFIIAVSIGVAGCKTTPPKPVPGKTTPQTSTPAVTETNLQALKIEMSAVRGAASKNGFDVYISAKVANPNLITIRLGNLQVTIQGESGIKYNQDTVPAGTVGPNSSTSVSHTLNLPLDALIEKNIIVALDGTGEAMDKTLPLSATAAIDMSRLRWELNPESVVLRGSFGKLSTDGLSAKLEITVKAPTTLRLDVASMQVVVTGRSAKVLMTTNINGESVEPTSTRTFTCEFTLPLEVLNETQVTIAVQGIAVLGRTTLDIKNSTTMPIPKLSALIPIPKIEIVYTLNYKSYSETGGYNAEVTVNATVKNDSEFNLATKDLKINIYKPDGTLVTSNVMIASASPAYSIKPYSAKFNMDYTGLVGLDLTLKVETEVSILNFTLSAPVSASVVVPLR